MAASVWCSGYLHWALGVGPTSDPDLGKRPHPNYTFKVSQFDITCVRSTYCVSKYATRIDVEQGWEN